MTRISVIVPCFNSEKYLSQCLDSILSQSRPPDEVIAVDDASTDSTFSLLQDYASKNPCVKILRNEENKGIGYARKAGVDACSGEYIAFLSSDDRWQPDFLKELLEIALMNPDAVTFCQTAIINASGMVTSETSLVEFETYGEFVKQVWDTARKFQMFVNFSGVLIPRAVFSRINFKETDRIGEDFQFLLESVTIHGIRYIPIMKPLLHYRVHEAMTTQLQMGRIRENDLRIISEVKAQLQGNRIKVTA